MTTWNHETFGKWLKYQRVIEHSMSQDRLAERLGVAQALISRWEQGWKQGLATEPPQLETCLDLSEVFEVDFIELATLCGRWNERIEKRVLKSLASGSTVGLPDADQKGAGRSAHNSRSVRRPKDNRPASRYLQRVA